MKLINSFFVFCLTGFLISSGAFAKNSNYRLGVVLVVDQFRADYLTRFQDQFVPASENSGGYRFLMEKGAYFPLADHELFQNMTCPGHAAILTGSYPYRNHISMNTWYDRDKRSEQYCVQDDEAKIIGSNGVMKEAKMGISPKNLNATTLGDELKNIDRSSRIVSISIKDRAAVMMGGKRANEAIWLDDHTCQWVTSSFYRNDLPGYAKKRNEALAQLKGKKYSWGPNHEVLYCSRESLQSPWGIEQTLLLAAAAMDEYQLGKGKDIDLLLISFSSHDYLGHRLGPNDEHLKELTLEEDKQFSAFFKGISKKIPGGMKEVFVVLTGDHGIPPTLKAIPQERMKSENVPVDELPNLVEKTMAAEFGKPSHGKWVQAMSEMQIYLNQEALKESKVSIEKVGEVLRKRLSQERYIDQVWMRDEVMLGRKIPAGEYGKVLDRTLSFRSGDVLIFLNPYFYSDTYALTHMTHYSYDRYVPLIIYGKTFKPGIYHEIVHVVDLAPTLSSVLGLLPPSQSEGRVLTEIIK